MRNSRIGVLALQGAFIEHEQMLTSLGAVCTEIRQPSDLIGIGGIVLPGGESTVQGQLLHKSGLFAPLKEKIAGGLPTLATCAGLILLAEEIGNSPATHLGTLPVTVKRNAYGRQLASFVTEASVTGIGNCPMIFIRAPYIEHAAENVEILAKVGGNIVAVRYENQIGLSFHPELSESPKIHEWFLTKCQNTAFSTRQHSLNGSRDQLHLAL
ncbi:MAG: pyridoxal 5'-phosphate synthase glutaminase subunit PdxT [Lachnospiraceae bacterium]|nr:pyridoxal 5'-phosphate synthase glutaminase subunit PdxT [Lachnospiraceae bacterium]